MKKVNQIDKPFCVVFDRLTDAGGARFIEVEDLAGQSLETKWSIREDGRAELVFACHEAPKSKLSRRIRMAVTRLLRAEEADSWKGCGDPADHPEIARQLEMARAGYANVLKEVDQHQSGEQRFGQPLAKQAAALLISQDATNYVGDVFAIELEDSDARFEVLVSTQKVGGITPHERAASLQAEADALKELLKEVAEKDPHGEFLGYALDSKINQAVYGPYGKKG